MAMPGGSPYGLPQVNAGALAAAPNYPGNYDFPGVTNGSHGLLGPQIKRNVPGQPIANPVRKKDGKWHRQKAFQGTQYYLDAGDSYATVTRYEPRKSPDSASMAKNYESWHRQELPKGAKYLVRASHHQLNPDRNDYSAHKTLRAAKRAAEKTLKDARSRVEKETARRDKGHTHDQAMQIMIKRYPDWEPGDLRDVVSSVSVTMDPYSASVQEAYQTLRGFI